MFGVDIDYLRTVLIFMILVLMVVGHLYYSREIRTLRKRMENAEDKEDGIIESQYAIINDHKQLRKEQQRVDSYIEQFTIRAARIETDILDLDRIYDKAIADINENWQFIYSALYVDRYAA